MMEKQVIALNNTLINFFKGTVHNLEASSSSIMFAKEGTIWPPLVRG